MPRHVNTWVPIRLGSLRGGGSLSQRARCSSYVLTETTRCARRTSHAARRTPHAARRTRSLQIFVFGGFDDAEEEHPGLQSLCTAAWEWDTPHADGVPPAGRFGHSSTLVGSRLFVAGGSTPVRPDIVALRQCMSPNV